VHYPEIQPYDQGLLEVGDENLVYWESSGNPNGKPALVVHGGPGSGSRPESRRSFDPERYQSFNSTSAAVGRAVLSPPTRPQT